MSTQHLAVPATYRLAVSLVWQSPFTGEQRVSFGRSKDEADRAMRLAVLREMTQHGVELAADPIPTDTEAPS